MKKWLFLAFCGLLSACSQSGIEELNTPTGGDAPIFYASVEGADTDSRTYLDEMGRMRWTHDDRITIFRKVNYNREYAFTGATGALSGGFKQISVDDEFIASEKITANYALYPHSTLTMLDPSGFFECTLPATQSYAEGSFGLNANTMVAVTENLEDNYLQFRNVCGYLKLNLYGDDVTVAQITLQGNNNEPLAGAAIITPTYGGEPTLTWAASGTTQVLTLDCGSGVKIGQTEEEATAFYLVVPPTTFEKGFAVTITDAEGKVCTKSTSNEQTFTRNVTKNMPAFAVKCEVPSNQIWYTSTDGNIVTPNKTDGFGVAIKSNTYTDGKGVITFEGDVTTIGYAAFRDCTSLASITIPEGVTKIERDAFKSCTSLASITIPEGVTTIERDAFARCTSLASITIPEGVTKIGDNPFRDCISLASITLPEGLTTIGRYAFQGCTSLASITLPESLTTIGGGAFLGCTSLATITLPEGVTEIGGYAFYGCTSLASITLPEGV
ncbi:MAG: leucine-rich repeat domain-containing protein, partial [Alistipes sp.]|nr:leucine-rich repeat domain-containing protein [Alistipes sp.]